MIKKNDAIASKNANEKKETAKKSTKAVNQKAELKKVSELDELKRELEKIKKENETLKKGKLKLSFENAQKIYLKKGKLIKDLNLYIETKEKVSEITLGTPEDAGLLDYDDYKLTFEKKDNYRNEKVVSTSNKLIIKEFIPFIIEKLNKKINELKIEIETLEI